MMAALMQTLNACCGSNCHQGCLDVLHISCLHWIKLGLELALRGGAPPPRKRSPRECYCVRSTSRLSVPPSEDVTFTRAGVIANVVVSLPALRVPCGSFGITAALSVVGQYWALKGA